MHNHIRGITNISISLIFTAVLLTVCVLFTQQAHEAQFKERDIRNFAKSLRENRYWGAYEGQKTGADVVDFIMRHKDTCDIVVRDAGLSSNSNLNGYVAEDTLILGQSASRDIPAAFWHVSFIYYNIIGGGGNRIYTAALLYDGQLSPVYDALGVQERSGTVTGVEFRAE